MTEGTPHFHAKQRMYNLVSNTEPRPDYVDVEYVYKNPFNETGDPKYDWKFDVYLVTPWPHVRRIAIEVDDKIGHTSSKSWKKRQKKVSYLMTQGIELFAWPRKWIHGRKAYPDEVFLEELHLQKAEPIAWYLQKTFK